MSPHTQIDLIREVREAVVDAVNTRGRFDKNWLHQQIVHAHIVSGEIGSEWSITTAYYAVAGVMNKVIRSLDGDEEADPRQLELPNVPGYRHLQSVYSVGGEVVRLPEMTDDELRAKSRQLRRSGLGHLEHADELDRYLADRTAQQPRA